MKSFGLTDEEVQASREKYGSNRMTEQKGEGFFKKLLNNFKDPMIIILCVALGINIIFAAIGQSEWYEPVGIAIAVLLATLVSTFSEFKNESAFQKLQEEASVIKCKVYRNGEVVEISIDEIVVGDCILLQSGDKIPADGFLIDGKIQVDQSVLNGEAKEAPKEVMPENYKEPEDGAMDFLNPYKVFRGSIVCYGNAVMQVAVVGDKSVYGHIASELQIETDRDTPLKLKLTKLAKQISKFGYIGGILIAVAFMICEGFINKNITSWPTFGKSLLDSIMLGVIIIVMAVPEGLPLMIAIVSAQNMGKMLKDNVLVRKISGIETAGSLNLLISDKTGTITKGQLETVTFIDGGLKDYKTFDELPEEIKKMFSVSVRYNTNAMITGEGDERRAVGGNATERALLEYVIKEEDNAKENVLANIPFSSKNKYSVSMVEGDITTTLIKGAPEKLLHRCGYYYNDKGEKVKFESLDELNAKLDELANRAIRVLALATTDTKVAEGSQELPDGEWTLVGCVGIRDEIRVESIDAISEVHKAGIQVIMITGDRRETARAIAKEVGLVTKDTDLVYTSDDLAKLSDEELKAQLPNIRVIARALPTDKSRFVRCAQELNLVVGMTGDGVNDSPALKRADIGFAMGSGTEVAKEASEIVVLDDNFHSIEKGILYGRTIFNNIRKFITFQLTINVLAVLISFISPLVGIEEPLTVIQILWVNLIMDTLAALAFGGEPALRRYMDEKPKTRDEAIVSGNMWSAIGTTALWLFTLSMIMLLSPLKEFFASEVDGQKVYLQLQTGFFTFFVFAAVFNAFNARTDRINVFENLGKNLPFIFVMLGIVVIQLVLTFFGGPVLGGYGLYTWQQWLIVLVGAISVIPVDIVRKLIVGAIAKNKAKKMADNESIAK